MKILIIGASGYIGSHIFNRLKKNGVDVVGIDYSNNKYNEINSSDIIHISYQNLKREFLNKFTDIIWLAGHSSVHICKNDEHGALQNNFLDLIKFVDSTSARFIYASSGSVYSRETLEYCTEDSPTMVPHNIYDYTKIAFDNYIHSTGRKAIALRFGTVNGFSENIREELMINSMYKSIKLNGYLSVNNIDNGRPILFIEDLVDGLERIISSKVESGIFNMCSFNHSIGEIAAKTADILNADVRKLKNTKTYNFCMSNDKFQKEFNFKFRGSIESIIKSLHKWNLKEN